MKLYKKSELKQVKGRIIDGDGVVLSTDDPDIINLYNALDDAVQRVRYLAAQPKAAPMPSLDGYSRQSELGTEIDFNVKTPAMDKMAEEAEKLMDEIDRVNNGEKMTDSLEMFKPLIDWADDDEAFMSEAWAPRIDAPILGNILEISAGEIFAVLAEIHGCDYVFHEKNEQE